MVFCQGSPSVRGFICSPARAALVWALTVHADPAWLDLPGAQGSRQHTPGDDKVTQAFLPQQSRPPTECSKRQSDENEYTKRRQSNDWKRGSRRS